jgi:chromosome segregation ATPase
VSDTTPGSTFRQTLRGYDPADVHARIDELTHQLFEARNRAETERRRADEFERAVEGMRSEVRELERRTGLPTYETVAQRVRTILETADEAAMELRTRSESDAEDRKRQAEDRVAEMLSEARQEADATVRRGRQVADQAIADSERRVDALRAEIAQLEQQRDRVLDALGSLRDRLTHVAQDLVTSTHGDERPFRQNNVVALPKAEERREPERRPEPEHHDEPSWQDRQEQQDGEQHDEGFRHDGEPDGGEHHEGEHHEHHGYDEPRAEGHWQG